MKYYTSRELSEKWGISQRRIVCMASEGRFPGAEKYGKSWIFPEGIQKPVDGRTKEARIDSGYDHFRFPFFVNDEGSYSPPLSEEETLLKKAQLDYYACDFEKAQKILDRLVNNTDSIHIRIMSLFYLCSLSVEVYEGENYMHYFGRLQLSLEEDFTHKKDMELVIPWLYTITVQLRTVSDSLKIDPLYGYSPSVRPLISYLSLYHLPENFSLKDPNIHFDVYEMLCHQLLQDGRYYEACELHFALFLAYYVLLKKELMLYHLNEGLILAGKYRLYIIPASYEFYYQDAFDIAFQNFPEDFVKLIKHYSEIISNSIGRFSHKYNTTEIYSTLSENDYRYLIFASQCRTNRETARALHLSERTVANRYAEIYTKLGIRNKNELVQMMEAASII